MRGVLSVGIITLGAIVSGAAPGHGPIPTLTLSGHWHVAEIDGRAFKGGTGLELRGTRDAIWWDPSCAGLFRHYRIQGHRFTTSGYRNGEAPTIMCTIAPPAEIEAAFKVLAGATKTDRMGDHGLVLEGGGHVLVLFSH